MTRVVQHSTTNDGDWTAVSERDPCPICGEGAECRRHATDAFVFCMRSPSEWPLTNGAWLHRVDSSGAVAAMVGGADP